MLTKELAIADIDWRRGELRPDRLLRGVHDHYRALAEKMLTAYGTSVGQTRRTIHARIRSILEHDSTCSPRRMAAFCKLLDDVSVYDTDKKHGAARLRSKVFRLAAPRHPLVSEKLGLFQSLEIEVKLAIAEELGTTWAELESKLYADVVEYHTLRKFDGYTSPDDLLSRYNVAQVQAALYDATRLTIVATQDFKVIMRAVKLARLCHVVTPLPNGCYKIQIDGAASVLRETRRYGVAMARMIPMLLSCQGWSLIAQIRYSRRGMLFQFQLTSADGLRSTVEDADPFDSDVEGTFFEDWGTEPRDGWRLVREAEILERRQKVFIPDFVLAHEDGRKIYFEIVGFWTPEYLQHKVETLRIFEDVPILLAIPKKSAAVLDDLPFPVVTYGTTLKAAAVLKAAHAYSAANGPNP